MLRGFELVSRLIVNFFESCLIGVNVGRVFIERVCDFSNCSEGKKKDGVWFNLEKAGAV